MLQIIDVEYLNNHKLEIHFNNRESAVVDFSEILNYGAYKELMDIDLFKQYGLVNGTLEWVNGLDLAPEFIYEKSLKQLQPHK